ncbi:MAG: hypothetical protein R2795_23610 [Saprospiraceae bacterium]
MVKQALFSVTDLVGEEIDSCHIQLAHRALRYDTTSKNWQTNRLNGGLLVTYLPDDTLVHQLTTLLNQPVVWRKLEYLSKTRTGYIVTTPVRWGKSTWLYLKRGIRTGNFRIYHWPFQRLLYRITTNRDWKGYLAANQPQYRHGDTLRMALHLNRPSGRPERKPLLMQFRQNDNTLFSQTVPPASPGYYTSEIVMGDSLRLDANYLVQWSNNARNYKRTRTRHWRFKLEDYELDEYRFQILPAFSVFGLDDPVSFELKAMDINEQPIPSATVHGYVLALAAEQNYTPVLVSPDTVWRFRAAFDNASSLTLTMPDSCRVIGKIKYQLHAQFQGASGESSTQTTTFAINHAPWQPELKLKGDSIAVRIVGSHVPTVKNGVLSTFGTSKIIDTLTAAPPFAVKLSTEATSYRYNIAGNSTLLLIAHQDHEIDFHYIWQHDTLIMQWKNPHRIPIQWTIESTSSTLAAGTCDSSLTLPIKLPQEKNEVFLQFNFNWRGRVNNQQIDLQALNNQLSIEIEVPPIVYPGETADILLHVKDKEGKPVDGAAITAGAYSSQFTKAAPWKIDNITFRHKRKPFERQRYAVSSNLMNHKNLVIEPGGIKNWG